MPAMCFWKYLIRYDLEADMTVDTIAIHDIMILCQIILFEGHDKHCSMIFIRSAWKRPYKLEMQNSSTNNKFWPI